MMRLATFCLALALAAVPSDSCSQYGGDWKSCLGADGAEACSLTCDSIFTCHNVTGDANGTSFDCGGADRLLTPVAAGCAAADCSARSAAGSSCPAVGGVCLRRC